MADLDDAAGAGPPMFAERWEVVRDEMRRRILVGELRAGSPIKELEIAGALGVSRGPVREAIRALEVTGLVTRRPQRMSIVTPVAPRDVDELYSLRAVIEDLAVRRSMGSRPAALGRVLGERVTALTRVLERGEPDPGVLAALDIDLHGAFYENAEHARLEAMWTTIRDPLRLMMAYTNTDLAPPRRRDAGHRAIVAAAIDGDVALTRALVAAHLDEARERILSILA